MSAPAKPPAPPTPAEAAKRLYELWATCGGVCKDGQGWAAQDRFDQQRWMWLAKTVGQISHDHVMKTPHDVAHYGQFDADLKDGWAYSIGMPDPSPVPVDNPTLREMVGAAALGHKPPSPPTPPKRWWQIWKR